MSFIKASTSFSRFWLLDEVPQELWGQIPDKLRQFAFLDIDDIPQERSVGWTNFDDMLDTQWRVSPPEKGEFLCFSLRMDTRRIPLAVLKKHSRLAIMEEEARVRELGKKFVPRERKKELTDQVKLRLWGRFLPIPAEFQVVWNTRTGRIYFASTQTRMIETFVEEFVKTFDLHLELLLPYSLGLSLLGEDASSRLDEVAPTSFV